MKRIKTILILHLLVGFIASINAQESETTSPKYEIDIKLYSNFLAFNSDYMPDHYHYEITPFQFWGITPAIFFRKKEGMIAHEFEPKVWARKRNDDDITEYEIGLRYEFCWYLKNDNVPGLRFGWGFSSRIYYYNANADATSFGSGSGAVNIQSGGVELAATLHLDIRLSKKLKIVFSFTNLNYSFAIEYYKFLSPGLNFSNSNSDILVFNQRVLRLGLGYVL